MKAIIILLMMAQDTKLVWTPEAPTARVCRTHTDSGYKECTQPIQSAEAHLLVTTKNKNLADNPWTYTYEAIVVNQRSKWECLYWPNTIVWPTIQKEAEVLGPVRQLSPAKKGSK